MKSLKDTLYEEAEGGDPAATPANTMGMGDPSLPTAENPGSGDVFVTAKACKEKKPRRRKRLAESVLDVDTKQADEDVLLTHCRSELEAIGLNENHDVKLRNGVLIISGNTRKGDEWTVNFRSNKKLDLPGISAIQMDGSIYSYSTGSIDGPTRGIPILEAHRINLHYLEDISNLNLIGHDQINLSWPRSSDVNLTNIHVKTPNVLVQTFGYDFPDVKKLKGEVDVLRIETKTPLQGGSKAWFEKYFYEEGENPFHNHAGESCNDLPLIERLRYFKSGKYVQDHLTMDRPLAKIKNVKLSDMIPTALKYKCICVSMDTLHVAFVKPEYATGLFASKGLLNVPGLASHKPWFDYEKPLPGKFYQTKILDENEFIRMCDDTLDGYKVIFFRK